MYRFSNTSVFFFAFATVLSSCLYEKEGDHDPMLGEACYPQEKAAKSQYVYLEVPRRGGHAGFTLSGRPYSYMEQRAEGFIQEKALG